MFKKQVIFYTQETIRQTANLVVDGKIVYAAAVVKNTFVSYNDTESFFDALSSFVHDNDLADLKGLVKTLFGG